MDIRVKRSFIGYNPVSANKIINSMNLDFEKKLKELEFELNSVITETEGLKNRIKEIKNELSLQVDLEKNMYEQLLKAHLQTTQLVRQTSEEAELHEKRKLEVVMDYEKLNIGLKKNLRKLAEEIHFTLEEYRDKLHSMHLEEEGDGNKK